MILHPSRSVTLHPDRPACDDDRPGWQTHELPTIPGQIKLAIMSSPHNPSQNHLLAALPTAEFERLLPKLELVPMQLGELLCESGVRLQHAYFPTTAILSLHH